MTDLPVLPSTDRPPFDGAAREVLERDGLPRFLPRQRWFGGKARDLRTTAVVDWADLSDGPTTARLALVRATYADGPDDLYQIPTAVVTGARADEILASRPDAVLARLPGGDRPLLCDAVMDDDACRTIFSASWREGPIASHGGGAVVASPLDPEAKPPDAHTLDVVRLPGTHSNSAMAIDGRYLFKIFRRLEAGLNPDIEIGRFLARHGQAVRVPALLGSLEYRNDRGDTTSLAMTQRLVPNDGTAWDRALAAVQAWLSASEPARDFRRDAHTLGRRTAELHRALGGGDHDPDFAPTMASRADARALADRIGRALGDVLDTLERRRGTLDEETARLATRVLGLRRSLEAHAASDGEALATFVELRGHGDYHLGQVLASDDDFVILDFEGEPTRSLAERRARQSPLRDVSGMLRSFSYAAYVGLSAAAGRDAERRRALEPRADDWTETVSAAFLSGYLEACRGADLLPRDPDQVHALIDLFLIEKVAYELDYEMNNRPDWVHIPLRGLVAIGRR